jgi:hypothetical protein
VSYFFRILTIVSAVSVIYTLVWWATPLVDYLDRSFVFHVALARDQVTIRISAGVENASGG